MAKHTIIKMGTSSGIGGIVERRSFFGLFRSEWVFVPAKSAFDSDSWTNKSTGEQPFTVGKEIDAFYKANYYAGAKQIEE